MSPNDEQRKPSVLSELPSGRPQLRSERRGGSNPKPAASKAKPAPRPKAAAKPRATAPAKPAATSKTKAAAKPKAATSKPKAAAKPKAATAKPKPKAAEPVAPPPKSDDRRFVTTAIQAAGELAQIGIAVGARAVRNALDRLPKP